MSRSFLPLLLVIAVAGASVAAAQDKDSADARNDWSKRGWRLTFHDEFDGNSIDPRHFVTRFDDDPKVPADVAVHDGVCHLLMERNAPTTRPDGPGRVSALETRHAHNGFAQKFGWFEVRARVAPGSGLGSGFWLLPLDPSYFKTTSDGGTRASADEPTAIDVFEFFGKDTRANNFDFHYGAGKNDQATESKHMIFPVKLSDDFHVYALNWTPTQLIWYVDGKEVQRSSKSPRTSFFIRLALFEGDIVWRGPVDQSHYPADFAIDYVRVYSKTNSTPQQ